MDGDGTLAVRCAEAVRPRVAAAEDDDALPGCKELSVDPIAGVHLVLLGQEVHGEVDALELAARHRQVARLGRAARQDYRIELPLQLLPRDVDAGVHGRPERHPLGGHLLHAAVDEPLLHLEVGDAVA